MKIFISYKSDYLPNKVDELQARLEHPDYHFEVLRDTSFIKAGNYFDEAIDTQLRDSDVVLILLSEAALKSRWVLAEIRFAFDLDKHIIPIWLEPPNIDLMPFYLRYIEYLEVWSADQWEISFDKLVKQLNERRQHLKNETSPALPKHHQPSVSMAHEDSHLLQQHGNPFVYGGSIQDNRLFCGRKELLKIIPERIIAKGQLQSLSLVGNRRIGKSSLLKHLERNATTLFKAHPQVVIVHLDLQPVRHIKGAMFMLREELNERLPDEQKDILWEKGDDGELMYFAHFAKTLYRRGIGLILLLDEIESLLAREELNEFVEALRSSGQQGHLAMITAGADTLYRLFVVGVDRFHKRSETSAFYNIFETAYVGLLAYDEWSPFVINAFQQAGRSVNASEINLINELAGGHAYFTQLAASLVFRGQIDKSSAKNIRDEFIMKAHDLLDDLWVRRTVPNQHAALYRLLGINRELPLDDAAFKTAIDELKFRGVVTAEDQIFSVPFRDFIINAPIPLQSS